MAQTLARRLNVPFAMADATTLTSSRLCGRGRGKCSAKIVRNCDSDTKRKQRAGALYNDEIDKISRKSRRRITIYLQ